MCDVGGGHPTSLRIVLVIIVIAWHEAPATHQNTPVELICNKVPFILNAKEGGGVPNHLAKHICSLVIYGLVSLYLWTWPLSCFLCKCIDSWSVKLPVQKCQNLTTSGTLWGFILFANSSFRLQLAKSNLKQKIWRTRFVLIVSFSMSETKAE